MTEPAEETVAGNPADPTVPPPRPRSDWPFYALFGVLGGVYLLLLVAMLVAESVHTSPGRVWAFLQTKEVRYSIGLSLITCGISAILSLWVAVPIGYVVSRFEFRGKSIADAVLDIPIVLPPLVVGLCLLILFRSPAVLGIESGLHGLESFVGRNLVPLVLFTVLGLVACLLDRLLRTALPRAVVRRMLLTTVTLAIWAVAARDHLHATWPLPSEPIAFASVENDDQSPLRRSRVVRTARTELEGTADEVLARVATDDERLGPPRIEVRSGLDGRENGIHVVTRTIRETATASSGLPRGGLVRYVLEPAVDEPRIEALRAELVDVQNDLEPLASLFSDNRSSSENRDSVDVLQQRFDALRATADDRDESVLRGEIARLLRDIDVRSAAATRTQRELDALRVGLRVLRESVADGRPLAELRPEYERLDRRAAEVGTEIERVRNAWRSESVAWSVTATIERPADSSAPNWRPSFVLPVTYEIPAVILAQFMVACAFAIRTMRVAFDQIDTRYEHVALVLGCTRSQAFWKVVFPQSRRGMMAAGTLAWARSLGEFGPILIFAGATRMKTEVLPTTVFLEFQTGEYEGAVAASLVIIGLALVVLVLTRMLGLKRMAM